MQTNPKVYKIVKHGKEELRIDNRGGDHVIPDDEWNIIKNVPCMLSPPEQRILWQLVKDLAHPQVIVANLGHADGGSAHIMGLAFVKYRKDGHIRSLDFFKEGNKFQTCEKALESYGLKDVVDLYRGCTYEIGEAWLKTSSLDFFDIVFIDAGHDYESVKRDWLIFSQMVRRGSVIAFHDTNQVYTDKVINEYVLPNKGWRLKYHVDRIKVFEYVG